MRTDYRPWIDRSKNHRKARSRVTNGSDVLPGVDGRSLVARRYRDIASGAAPAGSAWVQALRLEGRCRGRRGKELDPRIGRFNVLGADLDAGRKNGDLLDVRRQRADKVDARKIRQLAHLLEADLGFAARHDAADEY